MDGWMDGWVGGRVDGLFTFFAGQQGTFQFRDFLLTIFILMDFPIHIDTILKVWDCPLCILFNQCTLN